MMIDTLDDDQRQPTAALGWNTRSQRERTQAGKTGLARVVAEWEPAGLATPAAATVLDGGRDFVSLSELIRRVRRLDPARSDSATKATTLALLAYALERGDARASQFDSGRNHFVIWNCPVEDIVAHAADEWSGSDVSRTSGNPVARRRRGTMTRTRGPNDALASGVVSL